MTDNHDGVLGSSPAAGPTGHSGVDAVLASLEGLQDRSVADHVAVFEAAHERLRAALASAGDDASA